MLCGGMVVPHSPAQQVGYDFTVDDFKLVDYKATSLDKPVEVAI